MSRYLLPRFLGDRPALWYLTEYPPESFPPYHPGCSGVAWTPSVALGNKDAVQGVELVMHELAFIYELGCARVDTPNFLDRQSMIALKAAN